MTSDLAETLDAALRRLRAGESVTDITATSADQALVPLLEAAQMLESLQPLETPTPEALRADRDEFVMEIRRVQQQSVSPGRLMRLREWIAHSIPWTLSGNALQKKEKRHMTALIAKFALLFGLTFGSMGGAVALADASLPGSPLYSIKLASEEVTMNLTADPADRAALHLAQAQERAQEMVRVTQAGGVPDETTMTQLQTRLDQSLDQSLRLAAQLSDQDLAPWLVQAQQMTQAQEQALVQAQVRAAGPAQEPLRQASTLLKQAREGIEAGLQDPNSFRRRYTAGHPPEAPSQPAGTCTTGDCPPPGDQNQHGPGQPAGNTDGTCTTGDCPPPGDQNQHGPGEPAGNTDGTCTTGDCPPPGDQNQHGPGQPAGNTDGTCTTGDCPPPGDQNQHGPGEPAGNTDGTCSTGDCPPPGDQNQQGPGQPAGNTDGTCTTGDCPPPGDQNQHGPGQPAGNTDGTCTTGDCPPPGDQNQHGPGEPAGNTDGTCSTGDCPPPGDQNQYGQQPGPPEPQPEQSGPDVSGGGGRH